MTTATSPKTAVEIENGVAVDFQEAEETDELVAAVDEGIKAAEEGRVFTLEDIKTQMQSWITK